MSASGRVPIDWRQVDEWPYGPFPRRTVHDSPPSYGSSTWEDRREAPRLQTWSDSLRDTEREPSFRTRRSERRCTSGQGYRQVPLLRDLGSPGVFATKHQHLRVRPVVERAFSESGPTCDINQATVSHSVK